MAKSKKVLVAFDPLKSDKSSSDFLVPMKNKDGQLEFYGTQSKKSISYGMVILTSRFVTENDLFARLVDSGKKIPNVEESLDLFSKFLESMKTVKIGNVVEINRDSPDLVSLNVRSNTPSGFGAKT